MKTQELLELAALDALGLLDEGEREAFDIAFRAAAPALQAQIRREQTRIAGDDSLLPKIEAPLGLKARVMAAWREAVDKVADRSRTRRLVGALTLMPSRGVSPLWRAGAIGCAAASVVLAVAMFNIRGHFNEAQLAANSINAAEVWRKEFGATFERAFFAPGTDFVQFDASAADVKAQAVMLVDAESMTAQLYLRELPPGVGSYMLVALDADGKPLVDEAGEPVRVICEIRPTSLESGSIFNNKVKLGDRGSVGLVVTGQSPSDTKVLLRSRNL
jgi:hypothetical protein